MSQCLFCRIVAGEIPATMVHETENTIAFRDISPRAPTHVLVIPRTHYATFADMAEADPALTAELSRAMVDVAKAEGVAESGYRVIFNTGVDGGQEVPHVHGHVVGGRPLGRMIST